MDKARVTYTKKVQIPKKMNMRSIQQVWKISKN